MTALLYTAIPVLAVVLGSMIASIRQPSAGFISAMQHLAAGVVFAAAATEILPQVMHQASPLATFVGGGLGVAVMLALKAIEARFQSRIALLAAVGLDILIDGLVLGLAFIAGAKAGLLLTVALTFEVLFLGLTLTSELSETLKTRLKVVATVSFLALLLPLGTLIATPIAALPPVVNAGFLSFGLIALLYLVTEELLVEAHQNMDTPLISGMFFVGFLGLLIIEEMLG